MQLIIHPLTAMAAMAAAAAADKERSEAGSLAQNVASFVIWAAVEYGNGRLDTSWGRARAGCTNRGRPYWVGGRLWLGMHFLCFWTN
jgi:hypothetical protein